MTGEGLGCGVGNGGGFEGCGVWEGAWRVWWGDVGLAKGVVEEG